ncbi:MAG: hypothetical protein OXF52_02610 [Candidatus Dadabacteria bacterium]|nr:hypothetical protein [Candidatus Dadabacteria bacterium]
MSIPKSAPRLAAPPATMPENPLPSASATATFFFPARLSMSITGTKYRLAGVMQLTTLPYCVISSDAPP